MRSICPRRLVLIGLLKVTYKIMNVGAFPSSGDDIIEHLILLVHSGGTENGSHSRAPLLFPLHLLLLHGQREEEGPLHLLLLLLLDEGGGELHDLGLHRAHIMYRLSVTQGHRRGRDGRYSLFLSSSSFSSVVDCCNVSSSFSSVSTSPYAPP